MFLLDANALMEADRLYYAPDIAPGYWAWLGDDRLTGQIGSIDAVKTEITAGTGLLVTWARTLPTTFWAVDTDDAITAMADVAVWANAPARQYRQEAVEEFMGAADLKLIAHAIAGSGTVVTREQPAPDSKKKVKIPDVCDAFDVPWTDPFTAYRALGLSLIT